MKVAIVGRFENYDDEKPFCKRYYLDDWFKQIFDELDVLLVPIVSSNRLDEVVNMCDGLVVTGGVNNVCPIYYGEKPLDGIIYGYDEFPLVRDIVTLFDKANKPIFGICAGIQEINVIYGGSLYQQISNHYLKDGSKHAVFIKEKSFLYDVYKKDVIEVNSYHRQAIKKLANGFKISVISEDGIIEGIERDNIVAVQWHPEVLKDMTLFMNIVNKLFKRD